MKKCIFAFPWETLVFRYVSIELFAVRGPASWCSVEYTAGGPTLTWKLGQGTKQDQVLLVHSEAALLTLAARRRCLLICSFLLFERTWRLRGLAAAALREADARRKQTNIYLSKDSVLEVVINSKRQKK